MLVSVARKANMDTRDDGVECVELGHSSLSGTLPFFDWNTCPPVAHTGSLFLGDFSYKTREGFSLPVSFLEES